MSVAKDKREPGQLDVNTKARGACTYILKITGNEKNFPDTQRDIIERFRKLAIDIDLDCWNANETKVMNLDDYHDRLGLQEKAAKECTDMLKLNNIMKPLVHMSSKRYWYIVNEYVELRKMIRGWNRSDAKRLKPQ